MTEVLCTERGVGARYSGGLSLSGLRETSAPESAGGSPHGSTEHGECKGKGTHSVDVEGELARLCCDGYRPVALLPRLPPGPG